MTARPVTPDPAPDPAPRAAGGAVLDLPLAQVAPHPDNPRGTTPADLGDVDELAASMASGGLVQPIVVIPVSAFLEHRQADAAAAGDVELDGITHVVVAGHRRRAAALQLGWDTISALVRPDLAAEAARTFIVENLHRADLTPLQEAAGYVQLRDGGLSQREIAAAVGVSQSHVSKRLGLLRMPPAAQDALAGDLLTIAEAQLLGSLSEADQVKAWESIEPDLKKYGHGNVEWAVRRVAQDNAARKAIEKATRQAQHEGVELIEPRQQFTNPWQHELHDDDAIDQARTAGTLRAHATAWGLEYYTTEGEPDEPGGAGSPALAAQAREDRERRKAAKARTPALIRLVAKPPPVKQLAAELADAIVHGHVDHADALRMVRSWLPAAKFPQPDGNDSYYGWRDSLGAEQWPHVAWAMIVAANETRCRAGWVQWGTHQAAHIQRLVDVVGYEPTDWETEQLDRIATTPDDSDAATTTNGQLDE